MAERQGLHLHVPVRFTSWPANAIQNCSFNFVEPCRVLIPAFKNKNPAQDRVLCLLMAERQGFEPWNTCEDVTGIPVQRLRPLGHLSTSLIIAKHFLSDRQLNH